MSTKSIEFMKEIIDKNSTLEAIQNFVFYSNSKRKILSTLIEYESNGISYIKPNELQKLVGLSAPRTYILLKELALEGIISKTPNHTWSIDQSKLVQFIIANVARKKQEK